MESLNIVHHCDWGPLSTGSVPVVSFASPNPNPIVTPCGFSCIHCPVAFRSVPRSQQLQSQLSMLLGRVHRLFTDQR